MSFLSYPRNSGSIEAFYESTKEKVKDTEEIHFLSRPNCRGYCHYYTEKKDPYFTNWNWQKSSKHYIEKPSDYGI